MVYSLLISLQANGPEYEVETGRRDGRVSEISHADDLPDVGDSVQVLKDKFAQKGMTDKDLVLLSGTVSLSSSLSLSCTFGDIKVVGKPRHMSFVPHTNIILFWLNHKFSQTRHFRKFLIKWTASF